ncbi:MAG: InlB B-repeat-containing protein [Alphaproteobacteria bacterium]|nr:InlB B-repeat-containing protein [Alphaproteobacteria bacterium]
MSTGYYGIDCNSEGNGCTWQEICPVGSYCTGGKKFTCVDGTISDSTGATTCKSCPPGSYCKDGVIKTCEAGTYSTGGAATCTPCPEGSYSGSGASSCTLCEPAKYQDKTKQISCHDVPKGHYATGCREGALDDDKNCVGANCRGCKWHSICPDASVGERYYCSSGQKLSCAATNQLTECVDDNKGCTVCKACDDGKIVDGNGTLCDDCPAGYYCKGGVKYACLASEGEYQADEGRTSCELIPNGSRCSGKKQDGACPGTEYCTDYKYTNKDIYVDKSECQTVPAGSYATYCSSPGTGCKGYAECPAIDNEGKGYYCMSGKRNVCNAGSYLSDCKSGSTGCQECKSCPDGTTFAATVVVGVGNCGLQTCLDYYNKAKEGTGVWEEWYDNWSQCSSDGSSLAGCYMAPTKGINGAPVDTGAGTKPKCCSEGGTLEKCSYDNGMESCIATCTGCTGGNAQGGGCTADQMKLTDKHTCPGVQEVNKPSTCAATIACTCRYNDNLDLCNNYLNNATNGDKVCYKNEDGKDRTNYCETFCYKECDDSPCTQQCGNITVKTGVKGCTDKEDKYPGRQFKNNPECKYYDNGVPGTAPYCSVDITCKENYHKPRTTGCTPCLEGYHTKDDNTEEECTPNVYKVTLNRAGGENGTTEFFYEYKTKDDCYYYSNYNSTNGIVSGCLDVVDGKQTVQKPTRKGYTFAGYYTEADGKGTQYVDNAGKISEAIYTTLYDKTLYAKWTPNVYKVTLNPTPGSGGTSNYFYQYETKGKCYYYTSEDLSTCIEGTGGVQINKPTRTGYTFDGYYTEADGKGTQYVDKDGTTIGSIYKTIGDKTLFAKWTPNVFTVNFNRNDGATGAAAPESKTCTYDQACTAATQGTMRKTNHVFKGWDRDKEKDGDGEFGAEGDITNIISEGEITLYAIWKECDACVQSTGSKCELKVEDNECTYESGCIDGYTVVERTKDTNKPECTANEYSAIYFCGEGGGTPDPESDPVRFNDPYTVDISHRECSKPGSLFLGWEGKNNEDTIFAPYNVETEFTWAEVGDIEFTAKWDACPKGYYCGDGRVEQKECPVGSTTGGGADEIIDCYLLGGQSKICSKIGNEEPKCFTLPAGVKVNYSGDWRPSAE